MRDIFDELLEGGEAAIQQLVDRKTQETVDLEFKTKANSAHGKYDAPDRQNLAKELSAFSNSMGGLLVWGVDARKGEDDIDCAQALRKIAEIERFKSETQSLIGSLMMPKNEDIRVEAVHATDDPGSGYLLVLIGRSERRPHRSEAKGQREYFKRVGGSARQMEHYDIEDAFNRLAPPSLEIQWNLEVRHKRGDRWEWRLVLNLANETRVSARFPYLNLSDINGTKISAHNIIGERIYGLPQKTVGDWQCFLGGANDVIHPSQILVMTALQIDLVPADNNEWRYKDLHPLSFDYQCGCLNAKMRQDRMIIDRAQIDAVLIEKGVDIVRD